MSAQIGSIRRSHDVKFVPLEGGEVQVDSSNAPPTLVTHGRQMGVARRHPMVLAGTLGLLVGFLLAWVLQTNGLGPLTAHRTFNVKLDLPPRPGTMDGFREPLFLRHPWPRQVLPPEALARGLGPLGSGTALRRFAWKLVSGQPVLVVILGGSVSFGAGATWWGSSYPIVFADWLQRSFPRTNVTVLNRSIPASTSGLAAICTERLVPQGVDLVVLEYTLNDPSNMAWGSPYRIAFELLLRKLLGMESKPAVAMLHHFSWMRSLDRGYYPWPDTESDFSLLASYYDAPSLSLRAAVHPLMRRGVLGFKVDKVTGGDAGPDNPWINKTAKEEERGNYFYADSVHPSDVGHQALADLLVGLVQSSAATAAATAGTGGGQGPRGSGGGSALAGWSRRGAPGEPRDGMPGGSVVLEAAVEAEVQWQLPPPMQSGVVDAPTSLCLMQEDFKGAVVRQQGFVYRAERPGAASFVGQKWGWAADEPGSWAELVLDTRASKEVTSVEVQAVNATIHLGHIRSWGGMGRARVECTEGCACEPTSFEGIWERKATLQASHIFTVTQDPACRLRVTVLSEASGKGHKVVLSSVMIASGLELVNNGQDFQGALEAGRRRRQ